MRRWWFVLPALLLICPSWARADLTLFVLADTHYGPTVADSTRQQQLAALTSLPGTAYPGLIGGVVAPPDAVIICGDIVHDNVPWNQGAFEQFFTDFAGNGCDGPLACPVFECVGNHDLPIVRNEVIRRHGELLYEFDLKGIHFQTLGDLPTVSSIATVKSRLDALPAGTPIILFHHRALSNSPGYIDEWAPEAVDAYHDMVAGKNVIAILFGHDHNTRRFVWQGIDTYTPGSIRHSPASKYPESFLVIRITNNELAVASWTFGNKVVNNQHVWVGGAWGWTHKKSISTLPTSSNVSGR